MRATAEREIVRLWLERLNNRAANTVAWWAPQIRAGDEVRWPYDAVETAPIDERDIAAVAVRALSEASLAGADFLVFGAFYLRFLKRP